MMPNFNNNYNINLNQMKPIDPNKIDLYNSSLSIFDKIKKATQNCTLNGSDIYNIYDMRLDNFKESCKKNKLEDITKKAQFYFTLYNLINKKKCQHIIKNEYKCSFINTNLPFQPNKKIQININNKLFNGAILNPGMFQYNNKNGFINNKINNNNSGGFGANFDKNIYIDDKDNENTKSKKMNSKNNNDFVGKKRNSDNIILEQDSNDTDSSKQNKKKKNNENISEKNKNVKKKESPMLNIQKNEFTNNNRFRKRNNNIQKESKFTMPAESEKEEEEYANFEKDLKDYLRRTISEKRQNIFFGNILPESLDFVRNLFQKGSNIQINKFYPIYRNNNKELSLIIEPGGKIKKQLTNINI